MIWVGYGQGRFLKTYERVPCLLCATRQVARILYLLICIGISHDMGRVWARKVFKKPWYG